MNQHMNHLLRVARERFDCIGTIPTDIAAQLAALGVIVPFLEMRWTHDQQ